MAVIIVPHRTAVELSKDFFHNTNGQMMKPPRPPEDYHQNQAIQRFGCEDPTSSTSQAETFDVPIS